MNVNYMQFWKNVNESGLKELSENLSVFLYNFCSYLNTKMPMCFIYGHIMGVGECTVYWFCLMLPNCIMRCIVILEGSNCQVLK
jgi:hypothetical protein